MTCTAIPGDGYVVTCWRCSHMLCLNSILSSSPRTIQMPRSGTKEAVFVNTLPRRIESGEWLILQAGTQMLAAGDRTSRPTVSPYSAQQTSGNRCVWVCVQKRQCVCLSMRLWCMGLCSNLHLSMGNGQSDLWLAIVTAMILGISANDNTTYITRLLFCRLMGK